MKKESTATRLRKIMESKGLRQVDILKSTIPYCEKYGIKMNKSDISQYCLLEKMNLIKKNYSF